VQDTLGTVPLSTQLHKWALAILDSAILMLGGNSVIDWYAIQGGVEILLIASC